MPSAGEVRAWREEFPITQGRLYFDHATFGPPPTRHVRAANEFLIQMSTAGLPDLFDLSQTGVDRVRGQAARDPAVGRGTRGPAADALRRVDRQHVERGERAEVARRRARPRAPTSGEAGDPAIDLGDVYDPRRVHGLEGPPPAVLPAIVGQAVEQRVGD